MTVFDNPDASELDDIQMAFRTGYITGLQTQCSGDVSVPFKDKFQCYDWMAGYAASDRLINLPEGWLI